MDPSPGSAGNRKRWLAVLLSGGLAACGALWLIEKAANDFGIPFLPARKPAQWITYPTPQNPLRRHVIELDAEFRRVVDLHDMPAEARLEILAFKRVDVRINGKAIAFPGAGGTNWKQIRSVDVSARLRGGRNEIVATVFHDRGPPALWLNLSAGKSGISTDSTWQVSLAGAPWENARLASAPPPALRTPRGEAFPSLGEALGSRYRTFAAILALTIALFVAVRLLSRAAMAKRAPHGEADDDWLLPATVLSICVLWVALFWNNLVSLSHQDGFDSQGHLEYIRYLLDHRRLPWPDEGWSMFHPPFFYVMSALVLSLFGKSVPDEAGLQILRVQGLVSGLAQIVLVAACLRLIFPGRTRLQVAGTSVAGFLPMHLYLYQYVTNETLAATLASACLYLTLLIMRDERISAWRYAALGVGLGAAMLTKFSSLILVILVPAALSFRLLTRRVPFRAWPGSLGLTVVLCLIVCGWRFIAVWLRYRDPFFGITEAAFGPPFWQDPGYRTASHFLAFGKALSAPFFAGLGSFWDGVYATLWGDGLIGGKGDFQLAPPWNYDLMMAGYSLALAPTLAILTGFGAALVRFVRQPDALWFLLLGLPAGLGAVLLYLSVKLANYADVKAFYGMSAIVPLCALAALGAGVFLERGAWVRRITAVALCFWAINSYATFWIVRDTPRVHARLGLIAAGGEGMEEAAEKHLSAALEADPANAGARMGKILLLSRWGELLEAVTELRALVGDHPDYVPGRLMLAKYLATLGLNDEALSHSRRATLLAPDDDRAWLLLGTVETQRNETEAAALALRQVLRIIPAHPQAHAALAAILKSEGKFEEAARHDRLAQRRPLGPRGSGQ